MKNIKRLIVSALAISLLSAALTGCSSKTNNNDAGNTVANNTNNTENEEEVVATYADTSYLVDADWLKENLENDEVLILDARGDEAYAKGHIPGSISVSWQGFAKMDGAPGDTDWGTVLDAETLSEKLASIGVDNEKTLVIYADTESGWGEDGRFVWMLRMAGAYNSKMLDGGWNYWESNDYETSKEVTTPTVSSFKVEELNTSTTISTDELKYKLEDVVIIDSREKAEYDGATKYGEKRGGHIKNAKLLTFNTLLNEDGTLKSADELEKIFADAGLNKDDEIVTYCTAGIRSAHLQIVLAMAGYENAKNYDASYYEWSANEDLPIE
ncbi:sulfurtransferase [Clostridium sp. DL1XJH146]